MKKILIITLNILSGFKSKNYLKLLFVVLGISIPQNSQAEDQRFKIGEGADQEICQEIAKIIEEPENKDFIEPRTEKNLPSFAAKNHFSLSTEKFIIPKKYTNFSMPVWEEIKISNISNYIERQDKLYWFEENKKKITSIKRTLFDFDEDHKGVEILNISVNGKLRVCDVGQEHTGDDYYKGHGSCYFFYYKNKGYRASTAFDFTIYDKRIVTTDSLILPGNVIQPPQKVFKENKVCVFTPR